MTVWKAAGDAGGSMRIIGITGGAGSGKTKALAYIKSKYHCEVILADEVAHKIKEPGEKCYDSLVDLLGKDVLAPDGKIDKGKMAEKIFGDISLLGKVNGLIHPMVKEYILEEIRRLKEEGKTDFLFIEAALLIECGYEDIVDELWYVHAKEEVRRRRLKTFRKYTEEKIAGILNSQLTEEEFRGHCKTVIDNSGSLADTYRQIDRKLEEYL